MYKPKLEKEIRCQLEYGMDVFGGKWKPRIICVLADESPIRYGKLREETVNITDYVLTYTLKELTEDGLVERTQYNEIPPPGGIFSDGKGLFRSACFTGNLQLGRSISQGRK